MGRTARGEVTRKVRRRRARTWAGVFAALLATGAAWGVRDVVAAEGDAQVNVTESVTVSEGATALGPAVVTVNETIVATDSSGPALGAQVATSEAISVVDAPTVGTGVRISVFEVVAVADQTPFTLSTSTAVNESVTVTDSAQIVLSALPTSATSAEVVTVSDSILISVQNAAPAAATLTPASATKGGAAFTLTVDGSGFAASSVVHWNGTPRATSFVSATRLNAAIPESDLAISGPLAVAAVTVVTPAPGGGASAALPFVVRGAEVAASDSEIALVGGTASASTLPMTAGSAGVAATLSNAGGGAAIVTTATYASNPTGALVFDAGGGYVDLNVSGADASDTVDARFYYPSTTIGAAEASLQLRYFDGTGWPLVTGSGGVAPAKDTTDNLDGTVSGGRFSVTFSATSTPSVTALGGTVFAVLGQAPTVTTVANASGAFDVGVTLRALVTTLSPSAATVGDGVVTFDISQGGAAVRTVTAPVAGGVAEAAVAGLRVGTYSVIASYGGGAMYQPSTSPPAQLAIGCPAGASFPIAVMREDGTVLTTGTIRATYTTNGALCAARYELVVFGVVAGTGTYTADYTAAGAFDLTEGTLAFRGRTLPLTFAGTVDLNAGVTELTFAFRSGPSRTVRVTFTTTSTGQLVVTSVTVVPRR